MKCVVVTNLDHNQPTNELLQRACTQRDVEFQALDAKEIDFANLPSLPAGTLLYRVHTGRPYITLERWLLHEPVVTFYRSTPFLVNHKYAPLLLERNGVPAPKSIYFINRDYLDNAVTSIGGYPVIVKVIGSSHGVGVMRVDSREALVSLLDHLDQSKDYYILRQYIETKTSHRLTVVGDTVVDAITYHVRSGDFRSNVGTPEVSAYKPNEQMKKIAVAATHAMGFEFGGVDILENDDGMYVAEVNCPCFFPRSQEITGTDIAGAMIDHLIEKSKKHYG